MLNRTTLLMSSLMITLTACATQPKPEPVVQAVEAAPVILQAPVQETAPVIQQAPVQESAPVLTIDPNAPTPGSAADFAYQACLLYTSDAADE